MGHALNTGPAFGAEPTGSAIQLPGVDVIEVEKGQITALRSYFNENTLLKQLGFAE
ncbi:MAG: hypothetical protein IEMM0008_1446 [bacterium]|nr:MAG: hypothetical protein IEMM0008_1446 [bacterium]